MFGDEKEHHHYAQLRQWNLISAYAKKTILNSWHKIPELIVI